MILNCDNTFWTWFFTDIILIQFLFDILSCILIKSIQNSLSISWINLKFVDQMLLINSYTNLLISTICKLGSIVKVAVVMLSGI